MDGMSEFGRSALPKEPCVVCGANDARGAATTRLSTGEVVVVCGSHELMHRRSAKIARSVSDLKSLLSNRRSMRDRRSLQSGEEGDELGAQLSEAFATDQRNKSDRRAG